MHRVGIALAIVATMAVVPARVQASQFTVVAQVSPAALATGKTATFQIHTRIGAACIASLIYDNGKSLALAPKTPIRVGPSGVATWRWVVHSTSAASGDVAAACVWKGQQQIGLAHFVLARATIPPPQPRAAPTQQPAASLSVTVSVDPDPVTYGSYPTVSIQTSPNASCAISVVYDTGRAPVSYPQHSATADGMGTITESGQWHMESKGGGGTVSVTCTINGQTGSGSASFTIG